MADTALPMPATGTGWAEALKREWERVTASALRAVVPLRATGLALSGGVAPASALTSGLVAMTAAARRAAAALAAQAAAQVPTGVPTGGGPRTAPAPTGAPAPGPATGRPPAAALPAAAPGAGLAVATGPARALASGLNAASTAARSAQGGLDAAASATGRLAAPARAAATAAAAAGEESKKAADKMAALSQRGVLIGAAYAYATSRLLGFVTAGLSGTSTGEKLSYSVQQLQRSIASTFLPAIDAVIAKIQALTAWFRNLSGEQQQLVARFTGLAAGALAAAVVLPKLASALAVLGVGSPILSVVAALTALLARSEEGRETLVRFGEAAAEAFGGVVKIIQEALLPVLSAIASVIEAVILPAVEGLTAILESPIGKIALLGTVGFVAAMKIVAGFAAIKVAVASVVSPVGLVIGAFIAVAAAIGRASAATKQFAKDSAALAEQVHKGLSTEAKAREEIRIKAAIQAEEEAEKARKWAGIGPLGQSPWLREQQERLIEDQRERRQEELEKTGNEAFDRILKRLGKGRTEVETAKKESVSPADLIRKIEQAALAKDTDAPKKTAEGVWNIFELLKKLGALLGPKDPDRREDPPKAP